jgi:TM2 domain-containing membrane protein YozV
LKNHIIISVIILPFCPKCGMQTEQNDVYCKGCGMPLTQQPTPPSIPPYVPPRPTVSPKNEGLAAVLSVVWSGLGQIYTGRLSRGIVIMIAGVMMLFISWILLWIPQLLFWIWNIYDAYNQAKQYNRELTRTGNPPW